jgi:hypothetical protein
MKYLVGFSENPGRGSSNVIFDWLLCERFVGLREMRNYLGVGGFWSGEGIM